MNHIIKKHEIAGFKLFESLYPPKLKQPRHGHKLASFSFVLAGNYLESFGRGAQMREPSTVIFHPPEESHAVDFQNEATRILSVQVDSKRLAYIREHSIVLDSSQSRRTEKTALLGRRIHSEFSRMDAFSALAIEGLVFEILAEASRGKDAESERKRPQQQQQPHWLKQAKEFLHAHFSESIILKDMAREIGVHAVHLSRVFREQNGCTVGEYIRRLRVEFARRQISLTEIPLSEIALDAGFADQSHFTKIFKAHYGVTPSEYRRISRP